MTYELKVEGMSCGHCVGAVEAALEKVEGVEGARASLETGSVTIETRGEVELEALLGAVRAAGYGAEPAL